MEISEGKEMIYRIKNTNTTLLILGYYQILGGIIGIGVISRFLIRMNAINGPFLFIFLLSIFLFGFSIQSGSLLLQNDKLKRGLLFSIINHSLQLFSIGFGNYKYGFYSGVKGIVGFDFTDKFELDFEFAFSSIDMGLNMGGDELFFNVNIVSLILLSLLISIYNELKKQDFEFVKTKNAQSPDIKK